MVKGNMRLDFSTLSASSAYEQYLRHNISTLEWNEICLRRVEQLNSMIYAFITPTPELASQATLNNQR